MMLEEKIAEAANRVEQEIDTLLPENHNREAMLWEAMRYGCLKGGKRLRPFLVLESARLFDIDAEQAIRTAAAIELVHCYSLIHDDLPAMDNSDLRRGSPTVHRRFDEAMAILAGDALLTMAFEILSHPKTHPDATIRCALISGLAQAIGAAGMIGGQVLDMVTHHTPYSVNEIVRLQNLKTGALIGFAVKTGAILAGVDGIYRQALIDYAHDLGLAFQIADDLLDSEGTSEQIGKPVGQDSAVNKATIVALLGPKEARQRAQALAVQAAHRLAVFPNNADRLKSLAHFAVDRCM